MSVRKTNGIWRYRIVVKLPNGEKVRVSGTPEINTRQAAEREERLHIERLKVSAPARDVSPPLLLSEYARRWLDEHTIAAGNRSSTRTQRESHLRTRILPFFDGKHLDAIYSADIAAFRSKLLIDLAPASAASVMTVLSMLLKDAHSEGQFQTMPRMPGPIKVPEGKKLGFTEEEQAKLIAACETDEERLTLIFALDTGARAGEQLGIRWEDIDFTKRKIWIRRQRYAGETRETKTGTERYVDMTARLSEELGLRSMIVAPLDNHYVFAGEFHRPRTYSHLAHLLSKLCKRAGIKRVGWHKLRHTFASRCINRDVPPHVIQRWLGHTSLEHTMDYAHVDDGTGERFIKALDQ